MQYQAPPNPFRWGRSIVNPFRKYPQPAYRPQLEKVWEESLDKKQVELVCKGIIEDVVTAAVQQAENRKTAQVFAQLDTPVRDWVLGQDAPSQLQVQVQVHQSPRPVTPTICSPHAGEGWSPVSTPEHSIPSGTPRGTPVRGPSVGSIPKTPVTGIPIDVYGGIPEDQSGLVQTYMTQTPIHDIQAEEE